MSGHKTTEDFTIFNVCKSPHVKDRLDFFNMWAENYEKDSTMASYRAPHLAVDFLCEHFTGSREDVRVLDVACGTGWVAKLMFERGFRYFEGVDGSSGMLEQAAKTGLYKDLRLASLGTDPLPSPTGEFDVVTLIGGLRPGYVPFSVIRELHQAAKPEAYILVTRIDLKMVAGDQFKLSMEDELQQMENEGLWKHVAMEPMRDYMRYVYNDDKTYDSHFHGTMYLYRK